MTLMNKFLIGLTLVLFILGIIFFTMYLTNRKKVDPENKKQVRNQKLNFYLALYLLIGSLVVGLFLFIIF